MLVLSRKDGQRVRVGDLVEITVLESRNGRVKLGFSGPPGVPIHREEVLLRSAGVGARGVCVHAAADPCCR
jgi:carbon storage regulator